MARIQRLLIRLRSSFSHSRRDQELDAEIASHLDFAIEENIKRGMSPDEARRAALVKFGGVEQAKQQHREARGLPALEILWQDLRYAARTLRRDRSFALLAIVILAVGIGATTAMFSIIHAVLLEPLAYQDPDRVVLLTRGITPVRFDEMKAASRSYTELGAFSGVEHFTFSGMGEPEVLNGARVSGNFLHILGVSPLQGRGFLEQEDKLGAPAVVMISAEFWQSRFNRDPSAIGKSLILDGVPYAIIGILPPDFQFPFAGADVWVTKPSESSMIDPPSRPLSPTLTVFGHLRPGVTIEQAEAELGTLKRQYAMTHLGMLDAKLDQPESLQRLKDEVVSDVRTKLWLLMGAVGLVLLIVCANIGSLLLARSTSRSREFAVRAAIGAGRARLIKQLLAESLFLSSVGGALGVVLALTSLRVVRTMTFVDLPRAGEIHMDGMVLGFAVVLSIITGVLFGLVPSLIASRPNLSDVLKGSAEIINAVRSKKEKRSRMFASRSVLVVGQVALSVVLLIGATLLIESLARLSRVDPGFQPAHLLTMHVTLPPTRYETGAKLTAFYDQLIQRTDLLPGVRGAALSSTLPMAGWMGIPVQRAEGSEAKLNQRPIAILKVTSPEYFRTMDIPLKRGRAFNVHDHADSTPVAIISETFARRFWPQYPQGPDPIGQTIVMGAHHQVKEIVGISADVCEKGKDQALMPGLYLPAAQLPNVVPAELVVRTDGDPLLLANAVRGQILAIDSSVPVTKIATMEDVVEAQQGQLRLIMRLLGAFAGVATVLAIIGLCGVISYSVAQRTKEIGIRCVLGAPRRNIISLVIGQGLVISIVGVLLGITAAFGLTRVLKSFLFQVGTADPLTFAGISILFVLVAMFASYIPAHKAIRIDPMAALRTE